MAEGEERSAVQEAIAESAVGKSVRGAIEHAQQTNKEYWDIRQTIEARRDWHGGGLYKHYVANMDKMISFAFKGKELGFIGSIAEAFKKATVRVSGATMAVTSSTADVIYNFFSWPLRKLSPFGPPKDVFKRMALAKMDFNIAREAAKAGVVRTELGLSKGVRTATETAFMAPEIGAKMLKRRVDKVVDWVKSPFVDAKPNMPKPKM